MNIEPLEGISPPVFGFKKEKKNHLLATIYIFEGCGTILFIGTHKELAYHCIKKTWF